MAATEPGWGALTDRRRVLGYYARAFGVQMLNYSNGLHGDVPAFPVADRFEPLNIAPLPDVNYLIPSQSWLPWRETTHIECGWPLKSCAATYDAFASVMGDNFRVLSRGSLDLGPGPPLITEFHLPIGPIWSGLLINSLLYAACAFTLLTLMSGVLRVWRQRSNKKHGDGPIKDAPLSVSGPRDSAARARTVCIRAAIRFVVCAGVGVLSSFGIALAAEMWNQHSAWASLPRDGLEFWPESATHDLGYTERRFGLAYDAWEKIRLEVYDGPPLTRGELGFTEPTWVRSPQQMAGAPVIWDIGYGWPFVCLRAESRPAGQAPRKPSNPQMSTTWPIYPIASGLIADSVFFGVLSLIGWMCLSGFRAARRRRRRQMGLCTRCKYEIRDLATCPECGTQVTDS